MNHTGLKIRDLKASKADKAAVQPHIEELLKLKADYKQTTGEDYKPPAAANAAAPAAKVVSIF